MSLETPVGLNDYPITRFYMITTVVIPVIAAVTDLKYIFLLYFNPFISDYHQYYRYLTFQLSCVNESDVILLVLIWYNFRHLERLFGSYKYLNLLSLLWCYTTVIILFLNMMTNIFIPNLFGVKLWNRLPSGPIPLMLGLYHFYKQYTPKIYNFQILLFAPPINIWGKGTSMGISNSESSARDVIPNRKKILLTLSDQFIIDVLIILFILNNGVVGLFVGFISWITGVLIDKKIFLGLDHWRIPFMGHVLENKSRVNQNIRTQNSNETVLTQEQNLMSGEEYGNNFEDSLMNINGSASTTSFPSNNNNNTTTTTNSNNNNRLDNGINNQFEENDDQVGDEPVRPLRQQFLDVFRR